MEINNNYTVLRIVYAHKGFGLSGNLTHDIVNLCKQMLVDVCVFENAGGFNIKSNPGTRYLFGSQNGAVPNILEVILKQTQVDEFKTRVLEICKAGKDNVGFYTMPLEGYINNPDRIV